MGGPRFGVSRQGRPATGPAVFNVSRRFGPCRYGGPVSCSAGPSDATKAGRRRPTVSDGARAAKIGVALRTAICGRSVGPVTS